MLIEQPPPVLPPSNGLYLHETFSRRRRLQFRRARPTRVSIADLLGGALVLTLVVGCVLAVAAVTFGLLWLLSESLGFLLRRIGG